MAWVLFFDGDCGMCNRNVRRLADWDQEGHIHYGSLQGELASRHGLGKYLTGDDASVVLMNEDEESIWTQSDAVLQVMRILGGPWRLLLCFGWLPASWRNGLYRWIAKRRHRFGNKGQSLCEMPGESLSGRLRD